VQKDAIWVQKIVLPLVQASMVQIFYAYCTRSAIDTFTLREVVSLAPKEKTGGFLTNT